MRFRTSPPRTFAMLSLTLIVVIGVATSISQSTFFRQAIVERVSSIIYDMVQALVLEQEDEGQLQLSDLDQYTGEAARQHLEHSFHSLKRLSGVVLIKVFNRDGKIVWSDQPRLIGTDLTSNKAELALAMNGHVRTVFNRSDWGLPLQPVSPVRIIEFYVPFNLHGSAPQGASGVVSIYRDPDELNQTIRHGLLLLWLVTGVGGVILFAALYRLFRAVYSRQRETESLFAKFTVEHERMMQIEKLSALGQMVGEVAHQLNNPLVGVINLSQLAERESDNPQRVRELLAEVRKAGEHCREFVQRMLVINKVARSDPVLTDINVVVRDTIAFFQQSLGGDSAVIFQEPAQPVFAEVDPLLIRHALFNLINNAAQTNPVGPVVVSLALQERDGVQGCRLTVSDRGPGLSPEVRAQMFTPFFTTRPEGTGLGLAVVQQVAVQHGGRVEAENRVDGGARFSLWLPLKKQAT